MPTNIKNGNQAFKKAQKLLIINLKNIKFVLPCKFSFAYSLTPDMEHCMVSTIIEFHIIKCTCNMAMTIIANKINK